MIDTDNVDMEILDAKDWMCRPTYRLTRLYFIHSFAKIENIWSAASEVLLHYSPVLHGSVCIVMF